MIKPVNTTKKFTGGQVVTTALNNLSLEIDAGELTVDENVSLLDGAIAELATAVS